MTRAIMILSLLLAGSSSAQAGGRKVFLNGIDLLNVEVPIRQFKSCTVEFDKQGNVHISAPGFKMATIKQGDKTAANRSKPILSRRYFLVNKGMSAGKVQFDVTVSINGKKVRTVRPGVRDGVVEVTKYMRAGKNRVKLVARKNLGKNKQRVSRSARDEMEIIFGVGTIADGSVTLRKTVLSYERNAAETGTFTDSFDIRSE